MNAKGSCVFFTMVAISYYTFKLLSYKDVLILVNGSHSFNITAIKSLPYTALLYKVKHTHLLHLEETIETANTEDTMSNGDASNTNTTTTITTASTPTTNDFFSRISTNNSKDDGNILTSSWNYLILARGFDDDIAMRNYFQSLRHLHFITTYKKVTTISGTLDIMFSAYNILLRVWRQLGDLMDALPKRPLERAIGSIQRCKNDQDGDIEGEIHAISFVDIAEKENMKYYRNFFTLTASPAYNMDLVYIGTPISGNWATLVAFRYDSHDDYCELMSSKLYEDAIGHKYRGLSRSYAYLVQSL